MIDGSKTEYVEWFIVFTNSQMDHWFVKRLDKNFQHCYAMKRSEGGQFWIIVNPIKSHTEVTMELVDDFPHPRLYAGSDAVIVPVRAKVNTGSYRHTLCVINCVEITKSLLGLRAWRVWTPWQLYKRLRG